MSTIQEEGDTFIDDFSEATPAIKNAKREYSFFEFFKWEAIRDEIRRIDTEAD